MRSACLMEETAVGKTRMSSTVKTALVAEKVFR